MGFALLNDLGLRQCSYPLAREGATWKRLEFAGNQSFRFAILKGFNFPMSYPQLRSSQATKVKESETQSVEGNTDEVITHQRSTFYSINRDLATRRHRVVEVQ